MNDHDNLLKINGISMYTLERIISLMQDIEGLCFTADITDEANDIFDLKLEISNNNKFSVTYQGDEVMLEIVTDDYIWNESLEYTEFSTIEIV